MVLANPTKNASSTAISKGSHLPSLHARTRARTHTCARPLSRTHVQVHSDRQKQHRHRHTPMHARTPTRTLTLTYIHMHLHAHFVYTQAHTRTHTQTRAQTHTSTHKHTHTLKHKPQAHTHTHTRPHRSASFNYKIELSVPEDEDTTIHPYMSVVIGVIAAIALCLFLTLSRRMFLRHSIFSRLRRRMGVSGRRCMHVMWVWGWGWGCGGGFWCLHVSVYQDGGEWPSLYACDVSVSVGRCYFFRDIDVFRR